MTAPLRVALVIDYSLDYLGGAQSAFLDEARILLSAGHHVVLVVPSRGEDAEWAVRWRADGGEVVAVRAHATLPAVDLPIVRNTAGLRARLAGVFRARQIDVVHVHSEFGIAAAAVSAARRAGIATVQTVHTFFWQAPMPRLIGAGAALATRAFSRCLRGFPASTAPLADAPLDSALRGITLGLGERVDAVVSPSAHQAHRLRDAGLQRVAVVPNALALPIDDEPAAALSSIDGPLRIVWVGRLVAEKRILEWIDAVRIAAASLPPGSLEVEIVGEGALRAEAEHRAGNAPVRFLGRLERADVHERMRAAHLVALTSFGFDNQPVTVVEALHAARGVLYVDPSLTEGLDIAGILADDPGVRGMSDLLVRLARDPSRVVTVSQRTQDASRIFAPEEHVTRLAAVYRDALTRHVR